MILGDALVDPRFWVELFLAGTLMVAIKNMVFRGWERIMERVERKLTDKVR